MSDIAIKAENLGKKYVIGHQAENGRYLALRDVLMQNARTLWRKTKDLTKGKPVIQGDTLEEVWALKDVSFEIRRGEAVGIIGRNGAGKSTLLKILSRITEPSAGRVTIDGRVASLLEVGTGFHPELSGRENIYLNGTILGMTRKEIKRKFDEIVAFAEVEKYLDTPVKRYSSGMYVRLAFAVASHLEPEILVIDEVLAVGDAQFQKKCLGKMGEVSTREGRTVLFVSHNMDAVMRLCQKVILLKNGNLQGIGNSNSIIQSYLREDYGTTALRRWEDAEAQRSHIVRLVEVRVHNEAGVVGEVFNISKSIGITVEYEVLSPGSVLTPAFNLFNDRGINIFDSHDTSSEWRAKSKPPGHYFSTVWIPGNLLSEGIVVVGVAIVTPDPFYIHLHEKDVVAFNVVDNFSLDSARGNYVGPFPGVVRPLLKWHTVSNNHMESANSEL